MENGFYCKTCGKYLKFTDFELMDRFSVVEHGCDCGALYHVRNKVITLIKSGKINRPLDLSWIL